MIQAAGFMVVLVLLLVAGVAVMVGHRSRVSRINKMIADLDAQYPEFSAERKRKEGLLP